MFLSSSKTDFALVEVNHIFVCICIFTELNSVSKGTWDKEKQWNRTLIKMPSEPRETEFGVQRTLDQDLLAALTYYN